MSSVLFIPIRLNALPLASEQMSVGPLADFTLSPFFDFARDVPPGIAHISEEIISRPLQNETPHLKAGGRLHRASPDALAKRLRLLGSGSQTAPAVKGVAQGSSGDGSH